VKAFFCSLLPYELVLSGSSFAGALAAAFKWASIGTIAAVAIVIVSIIKHFVANSKQTQKDSVLPLEAGLDTLYSVVAGDDIGRDHGFRLCLHVPDGEHHLQQLTEYIGYPTEGRAGRRFPIQSGIIGRAFRKREPHFAHRLNEDPSRFINELIEEWSYSENDARKLSADRKSWFAVPIPADGGKVEAILYGDASANTFFNEHRQKLLICAASGIAAFVRRRYS
jgi:hypothetical protein